MTQPDKETIAQPDLRRRIKDIIELETWCDENRSLADVDTAVDAILALFPDATRQAERIAELERALERADRQFVALYTSISRGDAGTGERFAGQDEVVQGIRAALASAQSSTTGASDD